LRSGNEAPEEAGIQEAQGHLIVVSGDGRSEVALFDNVRQSVIEKPASGDGCGDQDEVSGDSFDGQEV